MPNTIQSITETLSGSTNKKIHGIVQFMNNALKSRGSKKLPVTQTKQNHIQTIQQVLSNSPQELVYEVYDNAHATDNDTFSLKETHNQLTQLESSIQNVEEEMDDVMNIMEKSIYGHSRAKSQIMMYL